MKQLENKDSKARMIKAVVKKVDSNNVDAQAVFDEDFLGDIIAMVPEHVYWMDREGVYLGCNDNQAKMLKLKSRFEIIGKINSDFKEIFEVEVIDSVNAINTRVMSEKKFFSIEEAGLVSGEKKVFRSTKTPLYKQNEVIGMVGISVDITAQKKLQEEVEAFASQAAQVAHDIRSPLAALSVALTLLPEIPEKYRIILRDFVTRINDIANNLLTEYKNQDVARNEDDFQSWLIAPLLESIISEKRLQHEQIKIETHISEAAFLVFSYFNAVEMKRVLSNLVNNAAEALEYENGKIIISMNVKDEQVILKIQDNGCGIPAEKLALVFQEGVSFKKHGSGLGLSHAKKSIEAWQGKINLESKLNDGTTVTITLPITETPAWFGAAIEVSSDNTIAILDDDDAIHGAWDQRFAASDAKHVPIVHFKLPRDLWHWCNDNQDKNVVVLSDYEILSQQLTGLDVLEKIKLGEKSFLVTSHYENQRILKRCEAANIKLLPKNLISHVPVLLREDN